MDDVFRRPVGHPPATLNRTPFDDDGPASLALARNKRSDRGSSDRCEGADVCGVGSRQARVIVTRQPSVFVTLPPCARARVAPSEATTGRTTGRTKGTRHPCRGCVAPPQGRAPASRPPPGMAAGVRFCASAASCSVSVSPCCQGSLTAARPQALGALRPWRRERAGSLWNHARPTVWIRMLVFSGRLPPGMRSAK